MANHKGQTSGSRRRIVVMGLCTLATLMGGVAPLQAYEPDDPKVVALLAKAVKYLETAEDRENSGRLGGECLIALAIHKYHKKFPESESKKLHPKVAKALQRVKAVTSSPDTMKNAFRASDSLYSLGIAIIFLTEVDPDKSRNETRVLLGELLTRQKQHGGWGYPSLQTGDISQTQYAVLGMWSAFNSGIDIGVTPMERVARFLARVQDPKGGWGYQANDPGNSQRARQSEITNSRTAAGLGSVYVAADFLGFSKEVADEEQKIEFITLPPALEPVWEDEEGNDVNKKPKKRIRYKSNMNYSILQTAMYDGDKWMVDNYSVSARAWQYYYLYACERYYSFRELVSGNFEKEPKWYNDGVDFLAANQDGSGEFTRGGSESAGRPVDTAFGCLFLLRSTKETISRLVNTGGTMRGGYGLPSDVSEARLTRDNKIQAPRVAVEMNDIMQMIEDDEDPDRFNDMIDNPGAYTIGDMTPAESRDYTQRLRRVLRSGTWRARVLGARVLGLQGDLDNVPILIYALTDPDPRVVEEARNGLRLVSRKFDGFGLEVSWKDKKRPEPAKLDKAIAQWKVWFRSVRPDAGFIDPPPAASAAAARRAGG